MKEGHESGLGKIAMEMGSKSVEDLEEEVNR